MLVLCLPSDLQNSKSCIGSQSCSISLLFFPFNTLVKLPPSNFKYDLCELYMYFAYFSSFHINLILDALLVRKTKTSKAKPYLFRCLFRWGGMESVSSSEFWVLPVKYHKFQNSTSGVRKFDLHHSLLWWYPIKSCPCCSFMQWN